MLASLRSGTRPTKVVSACGILTSFITLLVGALSIDSLQDAFDEDLGMLALFLSVSILLFLGFVAVVVCVCHNLPKVYVEFEAGRQCPLDVVFVVDSSFSVGEENFEKSKAFIAELVHELEMPEAQVGLIRFHHDFSVISSISGNRSQISESLDDMAFEAGETKISPALAHSEIMLKKAMASRKPLSSSHYRQVIVLITDGDSNDLLDAIHQAKLLKSQGVSIFCVHIGNLIHANALDALVSQPAECHAFKLSNHEELSIVPDRLLKKLVRVTRRARRAKCKLDLSNYVVTTDVSLIEGHDFIVPGWEPRGSKLWCWEPGHAKCLEYLPVGWEPEHSIQRAAVFEVTRDQPAQTENLKIFEAEAQTDDMMDIDLDLDLDTQTSLQAAETQTDPLLKIRLGAWRQAPLDLVICVDSSASFCLARRSVPNFLSDSEAFVGSGVFENVKRFLDLLATGMHMPEVQLGLIRFEDAAEMICPLTNHLRDFKDKLHSMAMSAGETKFAPALRLAMQMLDDGERRTNRFNDWEVLNPERAVLLITDGDPNDVSETSDLRNIFQDKDTQLLYVKVGHGVDKLGELSNSFPRLHQVEPCTVFRSKTDNLEDLQPLIPNIQRQLLRSTRRIEQARCAMTLGHHELEVLEHPEQVQGLDVMLSTSLPPALDFPEPWDQKAHLMEPPLITDKSQVEACVMSLPQKGMPMQLTLKPLWDHQLEDARTQQSLELKQECAKLRAEIDALLAEASAGEADKKLVKKQQAEIDALHAQVSTGEADKERVRQLQAENDALRAAALAGEADLERFKQLQEEIKTLRAEASTGETDKERLKRLQQLLYDETAAHEEDVKRIQARMCDQAAQHEEELSGRDRTISRLRAELAQHEEQVTGCDSNNARLHAELKNLHQQIASRDSEFFILRAESARHVEKITERDNENARLRAELKAKKSVRIDKAQDESALSLKIQGLQEQVRLELQQRLEAQQDLQKAQQDLQKLRDSQEANPQELELLWSQVRTLQQDLSDQTQRADVSEHVVDKLLIMLWNAKQFQLDRRQTPQRPSSAHVAKASRMESVKHLRQNLEAQHGNLVSAFRYIDDNHSGQITVTEMIKGLDQMGLSRKEAQTIFRRLQLLSSSQRSGSLSMSNWLTAFGLDDGQGTLTSSGPSHRHLLEAVRGLPGNIDEA